MSSIKECIDNLLENTRELSGHITSADEFFYTNGVRAKIKELELAIHEARKTFERTKDIDDTT